MKKLLKFGLSGVFTYGVNIGCTFILSSFFLISERWSYAISLFIVTIINFVISLHFTFKRTYTHTIFTKYILVLSIFSVINFMCVFIVKDLFPGFNLYYIIVCITTFVFLLKYFVYDKIVFK